MVTVLRGEMQVRWESRMHRLSGRNERRAYQMKCVTRLPITDACSPEAHGRATHGASTYDRSNAAENVVSTRYALDEYGTTYTLGNMAAAPS